jgi:hypothetical protein
VLIQIDKVKLDSCLLLEDAFDLEIKPLSVTVGVYIVLQQAVVFFIAYFQRNRQVA